MAGDVFTWLVAITAMGGAVELAIALLAAQNRETPGATTFGFLALAGSGWSFLQVIYLVTSNETVARLAYQASTPVAYQVALLWLVFAIVYAGHQDWLTPRRLVALWTPLTGYLLVRWTAPIHGVFAVPVSMETVAGITAPVQVETPSVLAATVLAHGYTLAGFTVLCAFLLRSRNVYRKQALAIVVGALFPTVGSFIFTTGYSIHPGVSPAPQLFAVHGIITALALFKYDFLSVSPVATDLLAEELNEPVLVLDDDEVVIDHNPAANRLVEDERLINDRVGDLLPAMAGKLRDDAQISVDAPGYEREMSTFSLRVSTIEDQFGDLRGYLVLMRDVTQQQRRLEQLTAMQAATQRFISARTTPEVARIAVEFASDVHDQPYAALFQYEAGTDSLVATEVTDRLASHIELSDGEKLRVPRENGALWDVYESGDVTVYEGDRVLVIDSYQLGAVSALILPLGDHGVLLIATDEASGYTETDEQLGQILARTTETALTRVDHESELRASRIAVERRNKQIEFFNGVLRHNIRNAMLVIDGHAQYLQDRANGSEVDKLETIRQWSRDLNEMTEKIRAVNDTVTASEDERLERVDISAVLREQVRECSERYDDVEVEVDVADGLTVTANALAADVISGVLSNAVEHNDSAPPRVSVSTETMGEWVQVRIADNGPGLSEEMQTQVFQREMATSETAHGFGLYFVSVMMDLYNGNVWFENRTGQQSPAERADEFSSGTEVVLEFRLVDEPLAETER